MDLGPGDASDCDLSAPDESVYDGVDLEADAGDANDVLNDPEQQGIDLEEDADGASDLDDPEQQGIDLGVDADDAPLEDTEPKEQPEQLARGNAMQKEWAAALQEEDPDWQTSRQDTGVTKEDGSQGYVDGINEETEEWLEYKSTDWGAKSYQSESAFRALVDDHYRQCESYAHSSQLAGRTGTIVYENRPDAPERAAYVEQTFRDLGVNVAWRQ